MRDAPSRCVLSFCEVLSDLLRWFMGGTILDTAWPLAWLWPWPWAWGLALVRDTPSCCVLSLCEVSLNLLQWFLSCCWDAFFYLWPDCGLGLGHRNLNHVRDTPSHYALSFYEVSSGLLQ